MKMEIEVDLEKFRLGLVGDGYLYDEVMAMPEEQLKAILQTRITHQIWCEYMRSRSLVLDILAARELEETEEVTEGDTKKYLYDIFLDDLPQGNCVGDQGEREFDTIEEAQADADDFIISELSKEYNKPAKDFRVEIYKALC